MKVFALGLLLLAAVDAALAANQVEEFSYQGNLDLNGQPANGTFPMTFTLFDASTGGNQVGAPVTKQSVSVVGGGFGVLLGYPGAFTGTQLWLEVEVNGQTIAPRHKVTAAPVAQFALNGGRALIYSESNPSVANTPPKTQLATVGPFTISASCGIDGSGQVTGTISANYSGNYDLRALASYQFNGTGAFVTVPANLINATGVQDVYFGTAAGNFVRVWEYSYILRSRDSPDVASVTFYMSVDARPATTSCLVEGLATSGV